MAFFNWRSFLALASAALLAACEEHTALVDPTVSSNINVVDVQSNPGSLPLKEDGTVRTGREYTISETQFIQQLDAALTRQIQARGMNGGTKAVLSVTPTKLALVSPGQALVVGGRSQIEGIVTLKTTQGETLVAPVTIKGFTDELRAGGLIGAMTTPSASEDYRRTLDGFANNVSRKLFENLTVGIGGTVIN
ncbi:hypothetical protein [Leisingera sp. JC1]|uniref:hypothetical protein n=1 Tax=Leisingera sp. JC1 TaxID=1855282 RepID=UPI00080344CE|nr:hypothetical protein [Leisingera sp. JC1]OBY25966.1 hypothetical protein A9D60_20750 [Leisingera sp. JC1]